MAQPHPRPPRVTAADRARWQGLCDTAAVQGDSGRYAEGRASMERLVGEIERVLGKEAEELVEPLKIIAACFRASGHLADSYTVMMRTLTLCEKHHGEDGYDTCLLRTTMGESNAIFAIY